MSDENRIDPEGDQVRDAQSAAGAGNPAPAAGRDGAAGTPIDDDRPEPWIEGDPQGCADDACAVPGATPSGPADPDLTADSDDDLPVISEDELRDLLDGAMNPDAAPAASTQAAAPADHDLLDDLRRVQAEYANYRRRTDREKDELADAVTGRVVKQLLPVLDDLGRARAAGDLEEGTPMQVIVAKLLGTIEKLGVEAYGEKGEPFDPKIHMAIAQLPNPDVEIETIADVVELGYRIGELELRPAKVAVFVPAG